MGVCGRADGNVGEAGETVAKAVVRRGSELVRVAEGGGERVLRRDLAFGVSDGERGKLLSAGEAGGAVTP
ncbi:hypothetical protein SMICM17S_03240 [Streptomyces microflavus]